MNDGDVGVRADLDGPFPRIQAHDLRRIRAELHAHLLERELALEHTRRVSERQKRLETGHTHRNLRPIAVPHRLLLAREGARVGGDDGDLTVMETGPQAIDVLRLFELRTPGEETAVGTLDTG